MAIREKQTTDPIVYLTSATDDFGPPGGAEYVLSAAGSVTAEAQRIAGGAWVQVESYQIASSYGRLRNAGTTLTITAGDRVVIIGDYHATRLLGYSSQMVTRVISQATAMKFLNARVEYKPISNENISAATLANAQTLTVPTGATGAWITVIEGTLGTNAGLFMTTEGSTPSATEGAFVKASNLPFQVDGSDLLSTMKWKADGATTARLSVEYYEEVLRVG